MQNTTTTLHAAAQPVLQGTLYMSGGAIQVWAAQHEASNLKQC